MKLKVNNIGLEDTENGGRNGRIRLIRVDRALCNICCRDVKLDFFRNRSSSRDTRLLTDHRNQGNSSGRR